MLRARIRMFGSRMVILLGEPRHMRLVRSVPSAAYVLRDGVSDELGPLALNVLDLTAIAARRLLTAGARTAPLRLS